MRTRRITLKVEVEGKTSIDLVAFLRTELGVVSAQELVTHVSALSSALGRDFML